MPSGARSKSHKWRVKVSEKDLRAVELRKQGKTFDEIARTVGWSNRSGAYHAVKRYLDALHKQTMFEASELRTIEEERLDKLYTVGHKLLQSDDPEIQLKAIDKLLKVADRRAKLRGLDAPKQMEVQGMPDVAIQILPPRVIDEETED